MRAALAGARRAAAGRGPPALGPARRCRRATLRGLGARGAASPAAGPAPAESSAAKAAGGGGSGGGGPQPGNNLSVGLLTAGCCAGAAGIAYLSQQTSGGSATVSQVDIRPMAEDVFENSDNLFVFFLERESDATSRVEDMRRIINVVASEPAMAGVTWHYSVRKEGDPAVPDGAGPTENVSDEFPPLKVIMYKGQRKTVLRIGAEVPKDEIVGFFTPVSETLPEDANGEGVIVHRVSGSTFVRDVVAASVNRPVLLQMYEDTCFLCFLMRPFVNSLAELLREHKVPLTIKRLNIEKNDFPSGCPVARGTPTFVIFRGPVAVAQPQKWEEFKPKELVEKICKDFPYLPEDLCARMDELQGLVSRRFQLFTQLVMWTVELQKLEALLGAGGEAAEEGSSKEDADFNAVVAEMMSRDMQRVDGIRDNLRHLQREVDEAEHDAVLMGTMLAEAVAKLEQAGPCAAR